jgi:hypothetical protein
VTFHSAKLSSKWATIAVITMVALGMSAWSTAGEGANAAERLAAAQSAVAEPKLAKPSDADDKPSAEKAASDKSDETAAKPWKNRGALPAFTAEREAAALTFVAAHHPELSPLLSYLKKSRPHEYERVIRRLFVDSERLAHSREVQPARYELELKGWMLESRIQLLVARLTMDRTPELEQKLRAALSEQLDVRREMLVFDRERMMSRVGQLDKELSQLDGHREQFLEERFQKALNPPKKKAGAKSSE